MMNTVPGMVLAFVVAISLLVAVHEFGHFWVARRLGVKVLRFSIGFGSPLWKTRFGADNTEFVLASLPLGGYVKMLDEREGPVDAAERARAFNHRPLWVRSAVILAGPLFNFLFAVLAFWLMFVSGVPGVKPVIGEVHPQSIAAQAGFSEGDELLRIDGRLVRTWDESTLALLDAALEQRASRIEVRTPDARLREYRIDFARAGDALAEGGLLKNLGFSPWRPRLEPVLGEVLSGGAAERAGLEPGDRLLAADGQPIADWTAWVDYVRARPEQRIVLEIERAGARRTLELVPQAVREGGKRIGRIGAMVRYPEGLLEQMRVVVRYDPFEAALRGAQKTLDTSLLTLRTLWGMLVGRASVENISGPLSIAQYAGHSAASGLASFLRFLGVVSVSLGVLNLLPVPVLDGGHLLYNLIEAVRRKPLSERAQQAGQQLGILLLLMLMSLAFYNDLSRLLGN